MRKLIYGLILIVVIALTILMNLKKLGVVKSFVYFPMEVHVVDKKNHTAKKVFGMNQKFNWDKSSQKYKICIGELTPTTMATSCVFENKSLIITHFLGESPVKQLPSVCFYVDFESNYCHMGTESEIVYTEEEISYKK